ncbi:unnamed protein product, partial [Meganyctiphanes norvegica]
RMSAECEVCATPYHSNVCNPRLLRCGHTICGSCVAHLIKIRSFFCPFCRASCRSIKSENELPLNRFILDLLEKENNDICDNNNVNNCLKNLDKSSINEGLNSSKSSVIPSSIPLVHAGVCQEHGYYRDMRCSSCNISICKQCTYCDHPQNICRVIPITKANLENHVRFRAKEKSHAVMHNCKYITDNLLTRLPRLEAAAKRQAKAVESLQSELEFQQMLQKEVDDHVANMKDVLNEGQKRQEVLRRTQQYLEDLENAQNTNKQELDNSKNQDDERKESILEPSCQTSINEAHSSDINNSSDVAETSIVSISNKTEDPISSFVVKCCESSTLELEKTSNHLDNTGNSSFNISVNPEEVSSSTSNVITCGIPQTEESISNFVVKCCDSSMLELENTLNHFDTTGNSSVNISVNSEEISSSTPNTTCSEAQNPENNIGTTSKDLKICEQTNEQAATTPGTTTDDPQISSEQTNIQAAPPPDTTTDDPQISSEQTNNKADPTPETTMDDPLISSEQTSNQAAPMPDTTTDDPLISSEQTNNQAAPTPNTTTDGPQISSEQTNNQAAPMPDTTIDGPQISSDQTNNQEAPIPDTTTDNPQISSEQTNTQAAPTPGTTTDGALPEFYGKTDITKVQITTLEDVQKIQKETEHFIQASQYLPWNRTASKVKKTQAIVFHAVELLDLCRTTQGYAPLVDGYLDDDYESEESEDDYDYEDWNNGGEEEEDADHTSEDEDDDFSDDGVVVVETREGATDEPDKSTQQNLRQISQEHHALTHNDKPRYPVIRTLLVPFTSLFSSVFSAFNGFKEMMTLPQLLDPHADESDNLYIDQLFL